MDLHLHPHRVALVTSGLALALLLAAASLRHQLRLARTRPFCSVLSRSFQTRSSFTFAGIELRVADGIMALI